MASCESRRGLLAGDLKNPSRPCYILGMSEIAHDLKHLLDIIGQQNLA